MKPIRQSIQATYDNRQTGDRYYVTSEPALALARAINTAATP